MTASKTFDRILLPVDGSDTSKRARDVARDLAKGNGVPVTVVSVVSRRDFMPSELMGAANMSKNDMDASREEEAMQLVHGIARVLREQGIDVDEEVLKGDPAESIVSRVRQMKRPLVVIGRRGLTGFREMVMGSVSNKVVHYAECPVLVVN